MKPASGAPAAAVLMVDDQPARLLTYESILSGLPIDCVRALSGNEALEQLLKREFAVILLDVSMPGMDGFELARMVREHPRLERTPIIFITGVHISELDRLKGYEVGAIDYISVPVAPEILRTKVALLVELHQRRGELRSLNHELAEARQRRDLEYADALAARELQLRAIIEHPDQFALIVEAERDGSGIVTDLICREVNGNAQRMLGVSRDILVGQRLTAILPQAHRLITRAAAVVQEAAGPAHIELPLGEATLAITLYRIGPDSLVISGVELPSGPSGQPAQSAEAPYRAMTEAIPQMAWSAGPDGTVDYYNRHFLTYLGMPTEQPSGDAWLEALHPDELSAARRAWEQARAGETQFLRECRVRRGVDGQYRWHLARAEPFRGVDGGVIRWFGTFTDVHALKGVEQARGESERRYRALIDYAPVGVMHVSLHDRIEYVNAALCQMLGYTPEELCRMSRRDLTHPHDQTAAELLTGRVLAGELGNYTLQKRFMRKDGTPLRVEVFGTFVFDQSGQPIQGIALVIDIQERLRAQAALRDSQDGLLLAKKAAQLGTFDWDIQTDVLLWDERTHEIWGTQRSGELSVAAFFSQVHPEDRAGAQRAIDKSFDPQGDHVLSALYRVINRIDGLTRWVEATGRVYFDGNRPARMVGVVQEVSERILSQQRLAESEHRFRELANHIDQIVWTSDALGRPAWYNDRWYEFTGLAAEKMRREDWTVAIPAAQLSGLTARANQAFSAGAAWEDTFQLRRKDGQYRWFLGRAIPIRNEKGEILRWLGTSTDITEQRRLQEALERADQRKDEFLAMLAHELRNPVAPISHAAEVLARVLGNEPRTQPFVQMIQRQVLHLSRLLDDLLDVARVTRGRITLDLEAVTLAECIQSAVESAQPLIQQRRHRLTLTDSPRSLPVSADRVRLAQCIGNVLLNAAKFTPADGTIEVRCYADRGDGVIEVTDNGIGIEAELLPQIFDLFVQGERSLDRSQGGLGIGLAICRQLIEMHGGTVAATSAGSGQGSTFRLRMPLAGGTAAAGASKGNRATSYHRILVVDDNQDAAESLAMLLESEGHTTQCVHSGPAALDVVASFEPSVVLLDIGLPGMDGYEVAAKLRAEGRGPDLKIIALTGYGHAEDRERALAAGCDEHLVKPASLEGIATALNRL